jgi:hypothetical protein
MFPVVFIPFLSMTHSHFKSNVIIVDPLVLSHASINLLDLPTLVTVVSVRNAHASALSASSLNTRS